MIDFCASGAHALLCAARRFSKSIIFAAFLFDTAKDFCSKSAGFIACLLGGVKLCVWYRLSVSRLFLCSFGLDGV